MIKQKTVISKTVTPILFPLIHPALAITDITDITELQIFQIISALQSYLFEIISHTFVSI